MLKPANIVLYIMLTLREMAGRERERMRMIEEEGRKEITKVLLVPKRRKCKMSAEGMQ